MKKRIGFLGLLGLCFWGMCGMAWAQQSGDELSGTLKKIAAQGSITVGYRVSSLPFSYLSPSGKPVGYSLDLCQEIVNAARTQLNQPGLRIEWVPVTSANRIESVMSGKVDLECGSTTSNHERAQKVAFSPIIFVAGTRLLVSRNSGVKSLKDFRGKTIVVTQGTTNEQAVRELSEKQGLALNVLAVKEHADAFDTLLKGEAFAWAGDDVLIQGMLVNNKRAKEFTLFSEMLSYDPYGIMFRKDDPQWSALVYQTLGQLAHSREWNQIYARWFTRSIPGGLSMNMPMGTALRGFIEILAGD